MSFITNYFTKSNAELDGHLGPQDIDEIEPIFRKKSYKKGEFIIKQGDTDSFLGVIESGLVRYYYVTFDGKEFNQLFCCENELIMNYFSSMSGQPSSFYIEVLEDVEIHVGQFSDFQDFLDGHPKWERFARKALEVNFILKAVREYQLLTLDMEQKYNDFKTRYPHLLERVSQHHIALYLGVNPSSLNRLIKKLSIT